MPPLPPELATLLAAGYVLCQKHPTAELFIFNYTSKTQYEGHWTEWTRRCRGLILDGQGRAVARPFEKFFNLDELGPNPVLPDEAFQVFDKLDGSLGILYWADDVAAIATRGSFVGEQARRATALLHRQYAPLLPGLDRSQTYLFEIIYPENRIVLDYGGREELVLLAVVDTATGREPLHLPRSTGFPVVAELAALPHPAAARALDRDDAEGVVLRYPTAGLRLKVKFAEYTRLHRILSQVSSLNLWEYLATGQPLAPILDRVPDEFYAWVKATVADLEARYAALETAARAAVAAAEPLRTDRKTLAAFVQAQPHPGILWRMLDGKPHAELIWKLVRPAFARPPQGGAALNEE